MIIAVDFDGTMVEDKYPRDWKIKGKRNRSIEETSGRRTLCNLVDL